MSRHQEHTQKKKTTEAAAPRETPFGEAYYHALARTYVAEPLRSRFAAFPLRRRIRRGSAYAAEELRGGLTSHRQAAPGSLQEWLADNYHLLSGKGEGVLEDLKYASGLSPMTTGVLPLYRLCLRLARGKGCSSGSGMGYPAGNRPAASPSDGTGLDQLSLCLRAALISLAAEACSQKGEEAVRPCPGR